MVLDEKQLRMQKIKKTLRWVAIVIITIDIILFMVLIFRKRALEPPTDFELYVASLKEQMPVGLGQEQALAMAFDYLNTMPFSREGLINQLVFSDCSPEAAEWAAEYCGADWNVQARLQAISYIDTMPFSRKGLTDQLEHDGFTTDEAKYGACNCGADWDEQAALAAKQYMNLLPMDKEQLIDQLKHDGFTNEQARRGAESCGF